MQKIETAARSLGIGVTHISDKFAMRLQKGGFTKYIVGNTFPLNDAACYRIAGHKNLCSDVLSADGIPNVPHRLVFSPSVLTRRRAKIGNRAILDSFLEQYGFPVVVKRDQSTKGQGVVLARNDAELEATLNQMYAVTSALTLSPFREHSREFRNIVLDGECLLSYEKLVPHLIGDGHQTVIELLAVFAASSGWRNAPSERLVDRALELDLTRIPRASERVPIQWRHNRAAGTRYELSPRGDVVALAVDAATAIGARFASVDVLYSAEAGVEVLEMSPSVSIHFPILDPERNKTFDGEVEIFRRALEAAFER